MTMKRVALTLFSLVAVLVPLFAANPASAATKSTHTDPGYFLHQVVTNCGGNVIQEGYDEWGPSQGRQLTAAKFISLTHAYLRDTGNGGQNQVGAAFIINTMLGEPQSRWGGASGRSRGIKNAFDREEEWTLLVRAYDANGWVNWGNAGHVYNEPGTHYKSTLWQGNNDCGSGTAWVPSKPNDVAEFQYYYDLTGLELITFYNRNGTRYRIDRHCGNPLGSNSPLQNPFSVSLSADHGGSPTILGQGQTYNLAVHLQNHGPGKSLPGQLQVEWPTSNICKPGASCPLNMSDLSNGYSSSKGFYNGVGISDPIVPPNQPNWRWDTKSIASSGKTTANGVLTFTTLPNATPGATITFVVFFYPRSGFESTPLRVTVTYKIDIVRYPGIHGLSGDIHAGGALCGQTPGAHNIIKGNAQSLSFGEFLISASGQVSGVGSNNSSSGTTATLGAHGNYSTICRPDLIAAANLYINANPSSTTDISGLTVDVSSLNEGIYYSRSGTLRLSGTFTKKITIVALGGSVVITKPIILNAPNVPPTQVPSMGILAANDININGAANRVDAYLFSNGTINTCSEGKTAPCISTLVVNGFIMAHALVFNRLGPLTGPAATVGEQINLTGQLYINPPMLLDNASAINLLESQGEKPPLL
ncbi:MAG: hypothetical protein JWN01_957 [Patescibacteria group bacterium]|nr:hypothetical protein [Patescibacteria group bacterium]